MKFLLLLLISGFLSLVAAPALVRGQHSRHRTSVVVTDEDDTYQLVADYNAEQGPGVMQYLNEELRPEPALVTTPGLTTRALALPDRTRLTVRAAPGRLRLTFDKQANSAASLTRIRRLMPELIRRLHATTI